MAKSKMICPKCGNEMNHHADKLIYSIEGREAANFDASLGGLIEETHGCPVAAPSLRVLPSKLA